MARLGARLGRGLTVTSRYIRANFNVSPATASRDMLDLECAIACDREPTDARLVALKAKKC